MDHLIVLIVVAVVLMVIDIVCGVANAVKEGNVQSSVMRTGLYNKFAEIVLLAVSCILQYGAVDVLDAVGVPEAVFDGVAVYIIVMEVVSILENCCKLNPNMPLSRIMGLFGDIGDDSK